MVYEEDAANPKTNILLFYMASIPIINELSF